PEGVELAHLKIGDVLVERRAAHPKSPVEEARFQSHLVVDRLLRLVGKRRRGLVDAPLLEPGRHAQVSQGVLAEVVVQSRLPRGSAPGALAAEIEKRAARGRIICANTNILRRREIT